MARVLCVDYGRRRAGLAVSDALGTTAQPLEVLERTKKSSLVDAVLEAARRVEADEIVVGLPLRLDGSSGVAAEAAQQFAHALRERSGMPVTLWDERLSTRQAARDMRAAGMTDRRQRGVVDKVAAAVILRSFLESRRPDTLIPDDASLPETPDAPDPQVDPYPTEAPSRPRSRSGRAREKKSRNSSGRQAWKRDIEDL